MRAGEFLLGIRYDVDLNQRWWHRLLKVSFVLGMLLLVIIAAYVACTRHQMPRLSDVEIVANLRGFSLKAAPEIANTIPAFSDLPGTLGAIKNDTIEDFSWFDLIKANNVCSSDLSRHAGDIANQFNTLDPPENRATPEHLQQATERLRQALQEEANHLAPGETRRVCLLAEDIRYTSDKIVKYRWTLTASTLYYGIAAVWALVTVMLAMLTSINFYYRGFVYIIFGPRRKSHDTEAKRNQ